MDLCCQKRIDRPPSRQTVAMTDIQSNHMTTEEAFAFLHKKIGGARTDGTVRQQDLRTIDAVFTAQLRFGEEVATEMMARAAAVNPGDYAERMNRQKQKRQKQATVERLRKRLAEKQ